MLLTPQEEKKREEDLKKHRKSVIRHRNLLSFLTVLAGFSLLSDVSSKAFASEKEPIK